MRFHHMARRIFLAPALGLALAVAITACSSSNSSSSSPAASTPAAPASSAAAGGGSSASAEAAIKTNWEAFFSSSTPTDQRAKYLQNGETFSTAIKAFAASPLAAAVSAKVDSVTLNSPTKATVKYDLTAAGTTVASGATGSAVLENGTWKVGDDVFCGLLKQGAALLKITVPAACNSAS
jgi:hypothetical protein